MTEESPSIMPKNDEEYKQDMMMAFVLGMNCTFQALDKDSEEQLKVFNVAKEVAKGNLYTGATGAEMRLKGLDMPADAEQASVRDERRIATIVCHMFARFLRESPD